jgi:hypothetical protein
MARRCRGKSSAPIWRDATNPEVWESPIYEQLLRVYDAIVYHGDVPDRVVDPDMAALRARMGPELDRRAKILAHAEDPEVTAIGQRCRRRLTRKWSRRAAELRQRAAHLQR